VLPVPNSEEGIMSSFMLLYGYFAYHCFANVKRGTLPLYRVAHYTDGTATTQRTTSMARRLSLSYEKRLKGSDTTIPYRIRGRG